MPESAQPAKHGLFIFNLSKISCQMLSWVSSSSTKLSLSIKNPLSNFVKSRNSLRNSQHHFNHVHLVYQSISQRRPFSAGHHSKWSLQNVSKVSVSTSPLIVYSTSRNPYHNLAIEHFLLTHSNPSSRILLFYTNRPCVVIGRNQNPWLECDLKRLQYGLSTENATLDFGTDKPQTPGENAPIDLVRRRSGGGTVFHDSGNLNYSVIVPNDKAFERRKHAEMVVRALKSMSTYSFDPVKVNERNDIVMLRDSEWLKISGSAFKLTRGRALHHGTLLYSSPNLLQISTWLRSPGRGSIHAKGVESVRSKIGNLMWLKDLPKREMLRKAIIEAIVDEFWSMYGEGPFPDSSVELVVGDDECRAEVNPSVSKGIREIMTRDWRFGQTPRFDFISGIVDEQEVKFFAHHGKLEQVKFYSIGGPHKEPYATFKYENPPNIHEIDDWEKLMKAASKGQKIQISDAMVQRISSTFPKCL